MSEPWPPAFMRTAPPTEPGTPTAHESPDHPASATRRARTGRDRAAPARTVGRTSAPASSARSSAPGSGNARPAKPEPSRRTNPSKPASATNRFDPRPITKTATVAPIRSCGTAHATAGRPDRLEVVGSLHLGEERRRAADPVGGHRSERLVAHRSRAERVGQGVEHRGRRHHDGESSSTSGNDVRSPAPRVKQRSPGCRISATASRSCSQAGA